MNAPTKIETPTGLNLLRQPFPAHQISKLPKGNVWLDYVGHAALTDRLLDADPAWNWEPLACDAAGLPAYDASGGLWIRLTVCGQTRLGYGHAGTKKGGDAIKEVIGDALRNAAMRFGAALDLWHKGDLHIDDGEGGHSQGYDQGDSSPPAEHQEAPRWSEPDSIYSGISKLKQGLKQHMHDLDGCGDSAEVYALCMTPDWAEFVRVCQLHAPWYLRGGEPAPPEFEGLIAKAERMVVEFDTAEANNRTALART